MTRPPRISIVHTTLPDSVDEVRQLKSIASRTLSREEAERVNRLRVGGAAEAFIVGRVLARRTLSEVIGCCPRDVPIKIDGHGRPVLEDHPWSFNLSHSGRHVVLAISLIPVGVDCQIADENLEPGFDETFATQREQWSLSTPSSVYRLWTRKEAVLKCLGTGFHMDPRSVELGDRSAIALPHPDRSTWTISVQQIQWPHDACLAVAWRHLSGSLRPLITVSSAPFIDECAVSPTLEMPDALY